MEHVIGQEQVPPVAARTGDTRRATVEASKLTKRLQRQTGEAIADYAMIEAGDRLMVCLSGGQYNYGFLDILLALKNHAPLAFDILAVTLDPNHPGLGAALP